MSGQGSRLKQCDFCGDLMSDVSGSSNPVCSKCVDKDTELFERVKSRLKYGERVTVAQLVQRTGVQRSHIERWVKTGRLGHVDL